MLRAGGLRTFALVALCVAGGALHASAQTEDVEPRVIGTRSTTLVGVSGSLSRVFSSEEIFAGGYTAQIDGHRFVFPKIAIRFGVVGSGTFGESSAEDDEADPNPGTPSLEALGGALYYFTPESVWSFYGGAEYRARITERLANDPGSVSGIAGLQGAISSRASFFVEGGYGVRLRRGDEGELLTRMVGLAGVRFRF
jgi:hypothetical protein